MTEPYYPECDSYFIDGLGHLCLMITRDTYIATAFTNRVELVYVPGSVFSKHAEATQEQINAYEKQRRYSR